MIRDALVEVMRHDVKDIDLGMTSITGVDVSPDLHLARVYMTGLTEENTKETVAELIKARSRIRHALGQRIRLRYTPELDFRYDDTTMRASRIEEILHKVLPKEETKAEPPDESEDEES